MTGQKRFIGRKTELESLNRTFKQKGFTMTVITGRRRIGKSTLIAEFIKDKKAIYYTASKVGQRRNLELLTDQVVRILDPDVSGAAFRSTEGLLDFITNKLGLEKLVFVIDEFPYWAENNEELLSILQKYIDTKWKEKNLYLILCGSSLSFMEDKVLSEKSPLFGRRDSQIHLKEFNYLEAAEFVPNYSYEDQAVCFGVTGGVAKYLSMFDPDKTLDENIQALYFKSDGYLYDEPHNLLTQEFTDVTIVNNVIEQIAEGENTLNLIADKIHENPSTVSYSLNRLISTGLVEKKYCITEENNRKKIQYVLKDNMFKFWYEFIPEAVSVIEIGHGEDYYNRLVKPRLHAYMGRIFEEMCRYFTLLKGISGEFGCFLTKVGTWWGTEKIAVPGRKQYYQSADIDVVGISTVDKTIVVGECKFKNEKIDENVYDTLIRRSKAIEGPYRLGAILLFSLSGFSDWFMTHKDDSMKLYTLEDLYHPSSSL